MCYWWFHGIICDYLCHFWQFGTLSCTGMISINDYVTFAGILTRANEKKERRKPRYFHVLLVLTRLRQSGFRQILSCHVIDAGWIEANIGGVPYSVSFIGCEANIENNLKKSWDSFWQSSVLKSKIHKEKFMVD